ncbi:MAG: hypothetical protein ACRCYX_07465 [Dermatophilaceae bacterium]
MKYRTIGTDPARDFADLEGPSPAVVREQADQSRERLGIEQIDLNYAHLRDPGTPLADQAAGLSALVAYSPLCSRGGVHPSRCANAGGLRPRAPQNASPYSMTADRSDPATEAGAPPGTASPERPGCCHVPPAGRSGIRVGRFQRSGDRPQAGVGVAGVDRDSALDGPQVARFGGEPLADQIAVPAEDRQPVRPSSSTAADLPHMVDRWH